jgi:hypothetical protein
MTADLREILARVERGEYQVQDDVFLARIDTY